MRHKFRLIVFDLDGTLVDAYQAIIASFNHTMRRLGLPEQSAGIIRRAVGGGDANLLKPFVRRQDLGNAVNMYRRHHAGALRAGSRIFAGVRGLLRTLKRRGYLLAVASNRPTRFSNIVIRHLGIGEYFDYVLCKDTLAFGKPHPMILQRIMRRLKCTPAETVFVGDMVIDVLTGRRARVVTVAVSTGSNSVEELKKTHPDFILSRVRDLVKVL